MSEPEKLSYTLEEAARATGVSRTTIWRQIKAGKLQSFRYAGKTLIMADDLRAALGAAREASQARARPLSRTG
jgi:excisionase family DNA binding protein